MRNISRQSKRLGLAVVAAWLLAPAMLLAQSMNSTNYRVPFDDLSGGGVRSTSTNYAAEDTIAEQATPSGENMASTNYSACAGFQCLQEGVFLTVDISTSSSACTDTTNSSAPYSAPLGALTTAGVSTAANHVCVRATTNATGGVIATVRSPGLRSISVPGDDINSVNATLVAGTEGYGVCSENAQNGFTAQAPFNGSCSGSNHTVGGPTTTPQIVWSSSGPVTNAFGDLRIKAAVSSSTDAHNDYADTLTFIVTATY